MTGPGARRQTIALIGAALLFAAVLTACSDDEPDSSGDDGAGSQSLSEIAEDNDALTEITDPPDADGPVVGTDIDGNESRVIDAAAYCDGYEQFQAYREGYVEAVAAATDVGDVEAWVLENAASGTEGAEKLQLSLTLSGRDVGMRPWTFVASTQQAIDSDQDLEFMSEQASTRGAELAGFDAAADELC